ncbi:EF-hand domain-containing protein [Roseovarius sp. M141]|uniref:EF-hand domain-containing protein n=1 Tax=Roseovarius sp. M141 TaxID=2583806 RepID=UPI0020CB80ED|nr:EF-hand domain-containing protein [Roseovarius sp. M141]MCQ0094003.1 hypothetical protein [Roseovarius sp. M141]
MKPTNSLPVLFAAAIALTAGTAIATAQTAPAQDASGTPAASAQVTKAASNGHRSHGRGHGYGGRGKSEMMQQMFQRMDGNGDGKVTQDEVDTFRAAQVTAADADGDGGLSIEEFDTVYRDLTRTKMVRAFQRLDADGDGTISDEEMDNRFGGLVERMDRNGDGALSMEDHGRGHGHKGGSRKD